MIMKKTTKTIIPVLLLTTALVVGCNTKRGASSVVPGSISSNDSVITSNNESVSSEHIISSDIPHSSSIDSGLSYGEPSSSIAENTSSTSNVSSNEAVSSSESHSSSKPASSSMVSSSTAASSSSTPSSSNSSSSSSSEVVLTGLDKIIAEFVSDLNITVPSLNEYNLVYDVYFYYAYGQYVISADASDASGSILTSYLNKFVASTGLVSLNDDTYYTVDDYGYLYADDANYPNVQINFYDEDSVFYFSITRSEGAGSLDVSNVDTNWYVDYVNFYSFTVMDVFPDEEINDVFETNVNIPYIYATYYPCRIVKDYYGDADDEFIYTFYLVLEEDQVADYAFTLEDAGYEVSLVENSEEDFDWDLMQYVDITYFTATATDPDHTLYITISTDESGNTLVAFYYFDDVISDALTNNTDWTDDEKELMMNTLGECLPFMKFGEGYRLYDDSDEEWDVLVFEDNYYTDLSLDYISLLLANGFKLDNSSYAYPCYYYDNGFVYIEIFLSFNSGHDFEIYFEATHLPEVTEVTLDSAEIEIVAGASYQLNVEFEPASSRNPIIWSSSNEAVASVENGLVTISEEAAIDESATITATLMNGLTASCTFIVVPNTVTAIRFTQDSYAVIPGATSFKVNWEPLPIGADFIGNVGYGIENPDLGINIDGHGNLWADADATVGASTRIYISCGSLIAYASVTVAPSSVTHTLDQAFFGLTQGYQTYDTYNVTTSDGAEYEAYCAAVHGVQIRSKSSDSGIIGHFEGRTCKSITFHIDGDNTYSGKDIDIYASNSPFDITDMFGSMEKIGSVHYEQSNTSTHTLTYTFTGSYSYIGFRSNNGAIFFDSIEITW